MSSSIVTESVRNCPHREVLEAFCVGKLSPRLLEAIAEHVVNCLSCRGVVDGFPDDSDALISHLRECAHDRTGIDDPECQQLEMKARAIRLTSESRRTASEWSTPLTVPGYDVHEEVGTGPHGISYRATHLGSGRSVRLKRLFPSLGLAADRFDRFHALVRRENLTGKRCLLPVSEAIATGTEHIVVTPWLEGVSLAQVIADRKAVRRGRRRDDCHRWALLDEPAYLQQIQRCLGEVLEGLAGLHEAGASHGGLKPPNVIIDNDDQLWLCDAGYHLLVDAKAQHESSRSEGPAAFVSPEQWQTPYAVDPRADVFSLGTLFYQALTLELPFGARRVLATDEPPAAPRRWQALLSPELSDLVLGMLQPYPRKRVRDATVLLAQWQRVQGGWPPQRAWSDMLRDFGSVLLRPFRK